MADVIAQGPVSTSLECTGDSAQGMVLWGCTGDGSVGVHRGRFCVFLYKKSIGFIFSVITGMNIIIRSRKGEELEKTSDQAVCNIYSGPAAAFG